MSRIPLAVLVIAVRVSIRNQLRQHTQQRIVVYIEILAQIVQGLVQFVCCFHLGLSGRLNASLGRCSLRLLRGNHGRASHKHKSLTAPAGTQQRFAQIYKGFPVLRQNQGGSRDAVATQFDGKFSSVNDQELPQRGEGIENFFKHGSFHATPELLLFSNAVGSTLHHVHAVQEMTKHHGRIGYHVISGTGMVEQQRIFNDNIGDAQKGLDLRIGKSPIAVIVAIVQEGIHS
mmetsp:Transcript_10595/g.30986  ORF Transcript_10595/g.30986 Transcript_10595/m.30986 type:complete len:231 (-) Transcript_10595:1391-2083(-)